MTDKPSIDSDDVLTTTAKVVSAYVGHNALSATEVRGFISDTYAAIRTLMLAEGQPQEAKLKPAVPVSRSVKPDKIICLEDGEDFKSLKRHLKARHNLTPDQYREKWHLPSNYPMTSPDYAAKRSEIAKSIGLGRATQKPRGHK